MINREFLKKLKENQIIPIMMMATVFLTSFSFGMSIVWSKVVIFFVLPFLTLLIVVQFVFHANKLFQLKGKAIIFIFLALIFVSTFTNFNYQNLQAFVKIFLSILFLISVSMFQEKKLNIVIVVLAILYMLIFCVDLILNSKVGGYYFITGNPNTVGGICAFFLISICLTNKNTKKNFFVLIFLIVFTAIARSRTALMCEIFFAFFYFLLAKFKDKKAVAKFASIIFLLLVLSVYLFIIFINQESGIFQFVNNISEKLFKKSLSSGREGLIRFLFSLENHSFRIGSQKLEELLYASSGLRNCHNAYFEILFSYGMLSFIMLLVMVVTMMCKICTNKKTDYFIVLAFVAILIYNLFEAAIFAATSFSSYLQLFILGIIYKNINNREVKLYD